ncbi:MAG: hypothetical protein R3B45_09615 [Bdellovibrionota bacterium]
MITTLQTKKVDFLDPYKDDVESTIIHHGPIVKAKPGESNAEVSLRILQLDEIRDYHFILRKIRR